MALTGETLKRLFEGYFIRRWNDNIHPIPLVEMDRHGHRMMVAFLMGRMEEARGVSVDWTHLVAGGTFHLLRKIVFSDLKPAVSSRLYKNKPEVLVRMNRHVIQEVSRFLDPQSVRLLDLFLHQDPEVTYPSHVRTHTFRLLRCASKFVTLREFELLKKVNPDTEEMHRIEEEIHSELHAFSDLPALHTFLLARPMARFNHVLEKLRYQQRWSQTYKMPPTSVMGHSVYVATLTWMFLNHIFHQKGLMYGMDNPPPVVTITYFAALFHDLAEAVTRDIVRPVKEWFVSVLRDRKGVEALGEQDQASYDAIKAIEAELLQEALDLVAQEGYPELRDQLEYFSLEEFANKRRTPAGMEVGVEEEVLLSSPLEAWPVWGRVVELADNLAAFVEAQQSVEMGIRPASLLRALTSLRNHLLAQAERGELVFAGVDLGEMVSSMVAI